MDVVNLAQQKLVEAKIDIIDTNIDNLTTAVSTVGTKVDTIVTSVFDWKDVSNSFAANTAAGHHTATVFDVTGSGFLVSLAKAGSFTIQVDSGVIWTIITDTCLSLKLRFNSALIVKSTTVVSANLYGQVVLDP